jgi:hypothetical protein
LARRSPYFYISRFKFCHRFIKLGSSFKKKRNNFWANLEHEAEKDDLARVFGEQPLLTPYGALDKLFIFDRESDRKTVET